MQQCSLKLLGYKVGLLAVEFPCVILKLACWPSCLRCPRCILRLACCPCCDCNLLGLMSVLFLHPSFAGKAKPMAQKSAQILRQKCAAVAPSITVSCAPSGQHPPFQPSSHYRVLFDHITRSPLAKASLLAVCPIRDVGVIMMRLACWPLTLHGHASYLL